MPTQSGSRRLLILVYAGFLLFGLSESMLGVAWPAMRLSLGAPLDALGLVITASGVGLFMASLFSGAVIARIGLGRALAASVVLRAGGIAVFAAAGSLPLGVAAGLLAGLGGGGIAATSNTYLARYHDARWMSWLHASFGIGATLGPMLLTALGGNPLGWRAGYMAAGGIALGVIAGHGLTSGQWRELEASGHAGEPVVQRAPPLDTLSLPLVWLGILLFVLYRGVEVTTGQWGFSLLTQARSLNDLGASRAMSTFWGALTVGRLLAGLVAPRLGAARLIRVALTGMLLGTLALVSGRAPWASSAALAVLGLAMAPVFPLLSADTPHRVGAAHTANAIGYQIAGGSLGGTALAALAGWLGAAADLEAIAWLLLAATLVLGLLNELIARRTAHRPLAHPATQA